jgi:hypothetical protein
MCVRDGDGRFRNSRKPAKISLEVLRARWVETESLRLQAWLTLEQIAQHIMKVAHGQEAPVVLLPDGVSFAAEYSISAQGIHKAVKRAYNRAPQRAVRENRAIDLQRIDEILLGQRKGAGAGDPSAATVVLHAIKLRAKLLGYDALIKDERPDNVGSSGCDEQEKRLKEIIEILPAEAKRQLIELVNAGFDLLKRRSEEN